MTYKDEQLRRTDVIEHKDFTHSQGEMPVSMIRMSEVEVKEVSWLWKPYIPFGKMTLLQGNPGEGKTYAAMKIIAACTNRITLPGMDEPPEPFNVIYQTAEDGLEDTVKPRLMEAGADLDRVFSIDEKDTPLTLMDERIEKAILQNDARLLVIDPVQAFLGPQVDMNRANEVRPIFRALGEMAMRTGCAILMIGHLNKASGLQSAYRGLGSIDFTASVRSVLFIVHTKQDPGIRVLTQEKSSLAPPGPSIAFALGDEEGFRWLGEYESTADELLSGSEGKKENKTGAAVRLIQSMLKDGKKVYCEEIDRAALEQGISSRTVRDAKAQLRGVLKSRIEPGTKKKIYWIEIKETGRKII